jgi:hypothetical protein
MHMHMVLDYWQLLRFWFLVLTTDNVTIENN